MKTIACAWLILFVSCAFAIMTQESAPSAREKLAQTNLSKVTVGPGKAPLRPKTCKGSSYGYINIAGRDKLSPAELGEYIAAKLQEGKIMTIYPETLDGIFAYEECPGN
jgi:hypothetical protein